MDKKQSDPFLEIDRTGLTIQILKFNSIVFPQTNIS